MSGQWGFSIPLLYLITADLTHHYLLLCAMLAIMFLRFELPGWSLLPLATGKTGIITKLSLCTGCHNHFYKQHKADLICTFSKTGFTLPSGCSLRACGTVYCSKCIQAGPAFKTRRENLKGLIFPKVNARLFPNYICEACQVQEVRM